MKQSFQSFLFDSATAAHQVEGGNTNSWTVWEQANAARLAREAGPQTSYVQGPTPVRDDIKAAVKSKDNYYLRIIIAVGAHQRP